MSSYGPSGPYGSKWWRHWAALAHEVLTATGSIHQPDSLLDALLDPKSGIQRAESRGKVAAGLCYVLGYDIVVFSEAEPR